MYGFITTYGNGYKKIYIPKCDDSSNKQPYHALTKEEREKENKRLRGVKSKGNFVQRASSTNSYEYFSTLTTDNEELANDPIRLLLLGKNFLLDSIKRYNYTNDHFIVVLEKFENRRKGFHLHSLTDFPLNLDDWDCSYGANRDKEDNIIKMELGERYYSNYYKKNNKNRNLYCEKLIFLANAEEDGVDIDDEIRSHAVGIAVRYIAKKIKETKELIEELYPDKERISLYASNVEKIDRNTEYVDIEEYFNNLENEKNGNYIDNIDFYDYEKSYQDIKFKILKKEINYKGFIDNKILKTIPYVAYKTYKIKNLEEEIQYFKFRIEEIFDLIEKLLKIDKDFDIDCYLKTIINFKDIICSLQRQITILANANLPNSDVLHCSYNCNSSMEKGSVKTPYHVAHSLYFYGWANRPIKRTYFSKKIKKPHTKERSFFDVNFDFSYLKNTFLLKFLNYIRHIPGDN